MRYLRNFNESIISDEVVKIQELDSLCKDSLAYLLDDKLTIGYNYYGDNGYGQPKTSKYLIIINNLDRNFLQWDDIKDHFIPFLERLNKRYKLYPFDRDDDCIKFNYQKSQSFTLDKIINDRIDIKYFWSILLMVEI